MALKFSQKPIKPFEKVDWKTYKECCEVQQVRENVNGQLRLTGVLCLVDSECSREEGIDITKLDDRKLVRRVKRIIREQNLLPRSFFHGETGVIEPYVVAVVAELTKPKIQKLDDDALASTITWMTAVDDDTECQTHAIKSSPLSLVLLRLRFYDPQISFLLHRSTEEKNSG